MNNGLKLLLMAAGAIVTCIVVVAGFQLTKSGKNDTNKAVSMIQNNDFNELKDYEGRRISGGQLKSLVEEYEEKEIYFLIKTKGSVALYGTYYNYDMNLNKVGTYDNENKISAEYINDFGQFKCSVDISENDVVIGLVFSQEG